MLELGVAEACVEGLSSLLVAVSDVTVPDTAVQEVVSNRVEIDPPHWTRVSMR